VVSDNDPKLLAWESACEDVRKRLETIDAHDRRLALTLLLAEYIVFDEPEENADLRLAIAIKALGDAVLEIAMDEDGDDGEDDREDRIAKATHKLLSSRKH
jgi:hypothetical protein